MVEKGMGMTSYRVLVTHPGGGAVVPRRKPVALDRRLERVSRRRHTFMRAEKVRDICLSLPGTTEELLWKDEHLVFKVGGKMFCILLVAGEAEGMFSFKCDEESF